MAVNPLVLRAQAFARGAYLRLRLQASPPVAMRALLAIFAGPDLPQSITPLDAADILSLAAAEHWEQIYRRSVADAGAGELEDRGAIPPVGTPPPDRLAAYRTDLARWETIRDDQFLQINDSPSALARYQIASEAYLRALDRYSTEEEKTRATRLKASEAARAAYEQTYADLSARYGDLGPQYELLIRQLAQHLVRFEQLEIDLTHPEYTHLVNLQLSLTNQLQKYTEATRQEVVKPAQEQAIRETLAIVERHFATAAPHLWRSCVDEIVRRASPAPMQLNEARAS